MTSPLSLLDLPKEQVLAVLGKEIADEEARLEFAQVEWDIEPTPLIRPLPPAEPYPVYALPDEVRAAAEAMHEAIQAPTGLICQSLLSTVHLVAQPHRNVEVDGRVYPVSENFITIGESGERKSACDREASKAVDFFQEEKKREYSAVAFEIENEQKIWSIEREKIIRDKRLSTEEKKDRLRMLGEEPHSFEMVLKTGDPTFPGLVKAFQAGQLSMGLFSDEGGVFLGGYSMQRDNERATLSGLSLLWDGKPIPRTRVEGGNSTIYGRRLSLHLMMQPVIATGLFSSSVATGQGFLSRCLCCAPESTVGTRLYQSIDLSLDPRMLTFHEQVGHLLEKPFPVHDRREMGLVPPGLSLTADAKEIWVQFHNHVEILQKVDRELAPIRGFASKAAEHVLRTAAGFATFATPDTLEINNHFIEAGIEVIQFYLGEALRLFHGAHDDAELVLAAKCHEWALNQEGGLLSIAELYKRGPNAVRSKAKAQRIIEKLEAHGLARKLPFGVEIRGQFRQDVWEVRSVS